MSSFNAIGGFFELELHKGAVLYPEATALNSARSCFEYILTILKPKKVYMPKFTCDVMLEPLQHTDTKYEFYQIDDKLEILDEPILGDDELLVYTNYFGIKNDYSALLAERYEDRVVIDSSQAFYYTRHGQEHVIYSPRKFVGVADGGYLVTTLSINDTLPQATSYQRSSHLLKRIDCGPEEAYADFQMNDASLSDEPVIKMSELTKGILKSINYTAIADARISNFAILHKALAHLNTLPIDLEKVSGVPMVYPLLLPNGQDVRRALIQQKIFVAMYWPNVLEWCELGDTEYGLAQNIVPLPIDQRYGAEDMARIIEAVKEAA